MNDPATYDMINGPVQNKNAKEFIPELVRPMKWKSTEIVLDFGCGSGFVTRNILFPEIKKQMPEGSNLEIFAVDISTAAVKHASEEYAHPSIKYQYFDIFDPRFNQFEGKFDKIFSFYALHWIPETTKVLERLYKMLKPGGEVGIYCTGMDRLNSEINEARRDPEFGDCFHEFAETREYANEFKRVGFEVLEAEKVTQRNFYEHFDNLADMLRSTGAARVLRGKEDKFRKFAAKAFKNWTKPAPTLNFPSRILFEYPLAIIRATKA